MIRQDEVYKIGVFNKPHGVKGELSFSFTDDVFDRVDADYLICEMDGILVPFFIEEYRFCSNTMALVKLERVDNADQARAFTNVDVYFPIKLVDEDAVGDMPTWNYFVGFRVVDECHGELGEIVDVDDSTLNVLFCIENGNANEEILLPAHKEFILKIDKRKRCLTVRIPDGLIDI